MTDVILQLVKELPAVVFTAKYLLNEYAALDWAIIIYICMVVLCFVGTCPLPVAMFVPVVFRVHKRTSLSRIVYLRTDLTLLFCFHVHLLSDCFV